MNQPHEHSTLTPLAKPTVDKVIESTAQADTSPQQAAEQGTLQASIDALNQKLVASTLARVQKEGVIRKRLNSTSSNWQKATWPGRACRTR